MTRQDFTAMLQAMARGWTERNYEAVVQFFAEDVRYIDPVRYRIASRAELLKFYENDEGYPQESLWHNIVFDEAQQMGAGEYSYRGTHLYHGLVLVKVQDGLITHWREYQHISDVAWEDFTAGFA
jgi:SnoaL-like domain